MGRATQGARVGMLAREEPPPTAARNSVLADLIELVPQLRGERGNWFRIAEFVSPSGAASAGKRLKAKYPDQIETSHARSETGSVLYARWMGSRSNGAQP